MPKLTKEMVDNLIREAMLQEKYAFKGSGEKFLDDIGIDGNNRTGLKPTRDRVGSLKKLAQPKDVFTADDIAKGMASNDPDYRDAASRIFKKAQDKEFRQDISSAISASAGLTQAPQSAADATTGEATGSIDINSFSFPRPLGDLTSATEGKFLQSQNELINSVFDQTTLYDRLQKLSEVSRALSQDDQNLATMSARNLLQYTMVADLFDLFLNQIDQRASGYMFETFLANLVGGKVTGGGNGIADFATSGGQAGSAKLFQSWSGITQSHKGLTNVGDSIHYVIGIHGKKQEEARTKIDLYYVVITLEAAGKDGSKTIIFSDSEGDPKNVAEFAKGKKIDISGKTNQDDFYVGSFDLGAGNSDYRARLNNMLQNTSVQGDGKEALSVMKSFFTGLYKAEEKTKQYVAQEDDANFDSANEALKQYDAADAFLVTLLNLLSPSGEVDKDSRQLTKTPVQENKQKKFQALDKMIEELMLEHLQGDTDDNN